MPAVELTNDDLAPFAVIEDIKAQAMIDDTLALAARIAPCIVDDSFLYPDAAKAVLRSAVLRWNDAGTGAMQTEIVGGIQTTFDTRQPRRAMFWPSEITQLQALCKGEDTGSFGVDTATLTTPAGRITSGLLAGHAEICSLNFGAAYCSCGYVLTSLFPLYEVS